MRSDLARLQEILAALLVRINQTWRIQVYLDKKITRLENRLDRLDRQRQKSVDSFFLLADQLPPEEIGSDE